MLRAIAGFRPVWLSINDLRLFIEIVLAITRENVRLPASVDAL